MVHRENKKENKTKQKKLQITRYLSCLLCLFIDISFSKKCLSYSEASFSGGCSAASAFTYKCVWFRIVRELRHRSPPTFLFRPKLQKGQNTKSKSVLTPPFSSKPPNTRALFRKKSSSPRLLNHRFFFVSFYNVPAHQYLLILPRYGIPLVSYTYTSANTHRLIGIFVDKIYRKPKHKTQ